MKIENYDSDFKDVINKNCCLHVGSLVMNKIENQKLCNHCKYVFNLNLHS